MTSDNVKPDAKTACPATVTIDGEEFPGDLREWESRDVLIFRPHHPIRDKLACTDDEQSDEPDLEEDL